MNKYGISCINLLVLLLVAVVLMACSDNSLSTNNSETNLSLEINKSFGSENGQLHKPFRADFFTSGGIQPGPESVEKCGEPPLFYNVQEGYGEGTHLGRFHIRITFCVDATELLDDGMLTEGESIPYYSNENTEGYFLAANGDMLYIDITEGEIHPTAEAGYVFEFNDPFEFTGGTGRFEDVSGEGNTHSLVMMEPVERTDHLWEGTLIFSR